MPVTNSTLMRSSLGFLIAGAVLVAGGILATLWLADRSNQVFDRIVEEREVRRAAIDLLSVLQDAETGQRGYLITQDERFLEPYYSGVELAPSFLQDLHERLDVRDDTAALIDGLDDLVVARLRHLEAGLELALAGDADAARATVETGEGRVLMEQIREILGEVRAAAELRIGPAIEEQRNLIGLLVVAVFVVAAIMAVLVAGAIAIVARRVRELDAAQEELRALNVSLEERVNQRTEDLIRANQEVQRFAYIVTHDLRAPLVNIMGFASELEAATKQLQAYVLADGGALSEQEIVEARTAAAEDLPEAIGFIRSSARKMDGLINAILKISRDGRRQLRPERIDLEELVGRSTDAVRHQIDEAGGTIETDVHVASVISDRTSLDQILGNLVDNAIKYAEPSRPLVLRLRALPMGTGYVRIEVEDNGRGIAEEDHERIFELFRRAGRQDREGEGIGLAHVRSLARNLGGEITVKSVQGEGSTFVLRLPIDLRRFIETTRG